MRLTRANDLKNGEGENGIGQISEKLEQIVIRLYSIDCHSQNKELNNVNSSVC